MAAATIQVHMIFTVGFSRQAYKVEPTGGFEGSQQTLQLRVQLSSRTGECKNSFCRDDTPAKECTL